MENINITWPSKRPLGEIEALLKECESRLDNESYKDKSLKIVAEVYRCLASEELRQLRNTVYKQQNMDRCDKLTCEEWRLMDKDIYSLGMWLQPDRGLNLKLNQMLSACTTKSNSYFDLPSGAKP